MKQGITLFVVDGCCLWWMVVVFLFVLAYIQMDFFVFVFSELTIVHFVVVHSELPSQAYEGKRWGTVSVCLNFHRKR